jgi:hypothetical protein
MEHKKPVITEVAVIFVRNSSLKDVSEGTKIEVIKIPMTVPEITPIIIF